jgi:hypothetical protein
MEQYTYQELQDIFTQINITYLHYIRDNFPDALLFHESHEISENGLIQFFHYLKFDDYCIIVQITYKKIDKDIIIKVYSVKVKIDDIVIGLNNIQTNTVDI